MWNAKRVLILMVGALIFLSAYIVYAQFLGGIDGLQPLPPEYLPNPNADAFAGPPQDEKGKILQLAFGSNCPEMKYPIQLWMRDKGIVIAAGDCRFEEDGRVRLTPFSGVHLPRSKTPRTQQDLYTIQCEDAFLTLDRPVKAFGELQDRKIVALELRGKPDILLTSNRGTQEKIDDLEVRIKTGPVIYEEAKHLLQSDEVVQIVDFQQQPHPTKVTAKGIEIHFNKNVSLNKAAPANPPVASVPNAAEPKKSDAANHVELLVLRSNVDMHLYVDVGESFLGNPTEGPDAKKDAKANKRTGEKSHVLIKTQGSLYYDIPKDLAWFESPPNQDHSNTPDHVLVSRENRINGTKKFDQLLCDHLKIQFRKKIGPASKDADASGTGNKEIESAVATARGGRDVVLAMDSENLEAFGTELHYIAPTKTEGPKTRIVGAPMHAVKDGHQIECPNLLLVGADKFGKGQTAFATGAGRIDLLKKENLQHPRPYHVTWKKTLTVRKETEKGKQFDVLTLLGDASFLNDEQGEELNGQQIDVWLEESPKEKKQNQARQKLHRAEANDKASARTPEFVIRETQRLGIYFQPGVPQKSVLPPPAKVEALEAPAPITLVQGTEGPRPIVQMARRVETADPTPPMNPTPKLPVQPMSGDRTVPPSALGNDGKAFLEPSQPGAPVKNAEKKKPRKPIELQAQSVDIYVLAHGSKNELKELFASGKVKVHQDPENKDAKGVDIISESLNLQHFVEGDLLLVYGQKHNLARLDIQDLVLIGPKVIIDQRKNSVDVEGEGAMEMPTSKNLQGESLKKPARLQVFWQKNMTFDGQFADYFGGVQAIQDSAWLKCDTMQVKLDQPIVFKESSKQKNTAKVEKLVCDRRLTVLEVKRNEKTKEYESASRVLGTSLAMDGQDGPIMVSGPGEFRHHAPGNSDVLGGPKKDDPKSPKASAEGPKKLALTVVTFEGWMRSTTKNNNRTTVFRDNIEVLHGTRPSLDSKIDKNALGEDDFYLRSEELHGFMQKVDTKNQQSLIAKRNVSFQAQTLQGKTIYGYADTVKFDESSDLIILEADDGNTVRIFEVAPNQPRPAPQLAKRFIWNRKTRGLTVDGPKNFGN